MPTMLNMFCFTTISNGNTNAIITIRHNRHSKGKTSREYLATANRLGGSDIGQKSIIGKNSLPKAVFDNKANNG